MSSVLERGEKEVSRDSRSLGFSETNPLPDPHEQRKLLGREVATREHRDYSVESPDEKSMDKLCGVWACFGWGLDVISGRQRPVTTRSCLDAVWGK